VKWDGSASKSLPDDSIEVDFSLAAAGASKEMESGMKKTGWRRLSVVGCATLAAAALASVVPVWSAPTSATRLVETTCGGEKSVDRILVAYASKHGATAEIAERIGQVLCQAVLPTDVRPADRVKDLAPYRAVVLGSAVYYGHWQKKAATFLKVHEKALAARPVWLFSSGPTGEGDPVTLLKGWRFPKDLQPIADRIRPRDVTVFHGKVDLEKLGFIEKTALNHVKAPVGDFRNWEAITAWAASIADASKTGDPGGSPGQ
jgi:menaquinone-dependent protoporphyrinogen oxidase